MQEQNQVRPATGKRNVRPQPIGDVIHCGCRKGGPLAVTDANLLLGRLIPDYFPKIFGKSENEPLDVDATRTEFEKLAQSINENSVNDFSLDEIIYG